MKIPICIKSYVESLEESLKDIEIILNQKDLNSEQKISKIIEALSNKELI